MALTFKSTGRETKVVIDRAADGRQRVARAVQSEHNPKFWNLELEHPSGARWPGTFHGNGLEAVVALTDLLHRTEREYEQERQRGDKPQAPTPDRNVRVDQFGRDAAADFRGRR